MGKKEKDKKIDPDSDAEKEALAQEVLSGNQPTTSAAADEKQNKHDADKQQQKTVSGKAAKSNKQKSDGDGLHVDEVQALDQDVASGKLPASSASADNDSKNQQNVPSGKTGKKSRKEKYNIDDDAELAAELEAALNDVPANKPAVAPVNESNIGVNVETQKDAKKGKSAAVPNAAAAAVTTKQHSDQQKKVTKDAESGKQQPKSVSKVAAVAATTDAVAESKPLAEADAAASSDVTENNNAGIEKTDATKTTTTKSAKGGKSAATSAAGAPRKAGPGAKFMQERLRLIKEQEEKAEREENERIQREEEAENERLKKVAEEEEQKKRKKEKEKLRRDRAKAAGKPVTAKQKAGNARAMAFLDQMRAQGVQIPQPGEKVVAKPKQSEQPAGDAVVADAAENADEVADDDAAESETTSSMADDDEHDQVVNDWEEHAIVVKSDADAEQQQKLSFQSNNNTTAAAASSPVNVVAPAVMPGANKSSKATLRSPVICVLGHVDTGKTKILDYIRKTHVQDSEAGGITQQIGATEVPLDAMKKQTSMVNDLKDIRLPGMLIIDTPGHEAFTNLRSRGSSMCDIAILVVDLMHGLEQQTIESIRLLKSRKTPFVVALNKVDRLYQWAAKPQTDIRDTIAAQPKNTQSDFRKRLDEIIAEFAAQELNVRLFWENPNMREFISAVPTSAHSGDGMGNLIALLIDLSQTFLVKRLTVSDELNCTVMEVKSLPGLGTTIDVILISGKLCESDTIVVAGQEGPIVTTVRGLLMPQPLREMRVRNEYLHFKEVTGAQGVKIIAKDLEKAVAGLPLLVARGEEQVEVHKKELQKMLASVLKSIKISDRGVYVQASTIGSLEALLEFLRTSKIAYCGINIGPVHKSDIRKAAVMLEHDAKYAAILAFDVRIEKEAQQLADELGVKIFAADIIYHLFDKWTKYTDDLHQKAKEELKSKVVFPARLRILPDHIYGRRDPIILGVRVEAGKLRLRTPICVPSKENIDIGVVSSIESNHKQQEVAEVGDEVCVRIDNVGSVPKLFGRHFDESDMLVSRITRESIDMLKEYFRDDMNKNDWQLIIELKKELQIF